MKQWLAAAVVTLAVAGGTWAWRSSAETPAEIDEATVNRAVDARLHQVLVGMIESQHRQAVARAGVR
jgi:hypothetical protein